MARGGQQVVEAGAAAAALQTVDAAEAMIVHQHDRELHAFLQLRGDQVEALRCAVERGVVAGGAAKADDFPVR